MLSDAERFNVAREIAAQLNARDDAMWWLVTEHKNLGHVVGHDDGRTVYLDQRPGSTTYGRLRITGLWPVSQQRVYTPGQRVAITVREDRGAKMIAREVVRRFIEPYTDAYRRTTLEKQQEDEYLEATRRTAEMMATLVDESHVGGPSEMQPTIYGRIATHRVDVCVTGDYARIEITDVCVENLARIVHILRDAAKKGDDR